LTENHHDATSNACCYLGGYLAAVGRTSSVSPDLAQWCRSFCWQSFGSADRLAGLRILAGQMRGALGAGNVAVRTVYVATRLLGAASRPAAPPAEVIQVRWTFRSPSEVEGTLAELERVRRSA